MSGPGPEWSSIEPEGYLSELAGLLLSDANVSGLLDVIVNVAVSAVSGVDGASVSLLVSDGKSFETTNASSELIRTIDEAQYDGEGGPCVEAIRTGRETTYSTATDQWPAFAARAVEAGVHAVWSLPLKVRERTTGALNLYAMKSDPWADPAARVARDLAFQAAIVLANAAALMSAEVANENLRVALQTRDVIGQAKGILMARQGVGSDEAFDVLRRASQRSNRKLRDIAIEVVGRIASPDEST